MFTMPASPGAWRATSREVLSTVFGDDQPTVWAKHMVHAIGVQEAL